VNELRGEKVDVVQWRADTGQFIAEALGPAKVQEVIIDEDDRSAIVIVSEHQLSLAIGREGQNARLAAKLTGYRIDIRSEETRHRADERTAEAATPEPPAAAPAAESVDGPATADGEVTADTEVTVETEPESPENASEPDVPAEAGEDDNEDGEA
jgi:N utilization substance protein A